MIRKLRSRSVRTNLIILLLLLALPSMWVIIDSGMDRRNEAMDEAKKACLRVVATLATEQQAVVAGVQQLVTALALMPDVQSRNPKATNALLSELLKKNPRYSNIGIGDKSGLVWASAIPFEGELSMADRRYYQEAVRTGMFSSGEYGVGKAAHKRMMSFGYPVKNTSHELVSVIGVALDLDHAQQVFDKIDLPAGASFSLLDHQGVILIRNRRDSFSEKLVGRRDIREDNFTKAKEGPDEGTFETIGNDGKARLVAYKRISLPHESKPYLYVRSSMPVASITWKANAAILKNVTILVLLFGVGLFFVCFVGKRVIVNPIMLLKRASDQLKAGTKTVNVSHAVKGGELGELARAFDAMAEGLAQREAALRESEQRWATTLGSIGDAVIATDEAGNITFMNAVAEGLTCWAFKDAFQRPVTEVFKIINDHTRKEVESPVDKVLREGSVVGLANHTILVRKDGTEVPIDDSGAPIKDGLGTTTGVVLVFRDITERKQAEREMNALLTAVQIEKDRLSALVNSVQDEIWFADTEKRFILANPSALREFGFDVSTGEIDIEKFAQSLEVLCPDGSPRAVEEAPPLRALKGEMVENQEEIIRNPLSGELRYREVSAAPVRDAGNTIIGSVSVARDITERKHAEDALKRSMERLDIISSTAGRLLMSSEPQKIVEELCTRVMEHLDCHAFFNFLVDETGSRMQLNAYAGIPDETAKGIHFLDFGVAICGCAARDACRIVAENIPTTPDIRTDLVRSFGIKAYACHPLFARGQVIGTLSFGTRSRCTFQEDELSLMKTVADQVATAMERMRLLRFAEGRAAELELRVRERAAELKKQAELLDLAHDAIIVRNGEGRILYWNVGAETTYGWTRDEAVGSITDHLLKTKYPEPLQTIIEAVYGKGIWEGELVHTGKDGREIVVLSRWTVRRGEAGEPEEILEINRDITDRKVVEDRLRQSQKMEAMGTLAGGIAHDFNNILAAILGFTELAVEDVPDRPLVEKNMRNVLTSAKRARDLVKQILTFSRKTGYERSPLSLSPLVKETIELLRASIPATIEIRLSVAADPDMVAAAPVEIQQVVMNLATNASLAMQEMGGVMEVSLSDVNPGSSPLGLPPGEYLELTVKDTGAGMSPEVIKRIFEPFFTTREVGKGSGMGLAVVYGIVKDLEGTITVESQPGIGSTFRVILPKAKTDEKEETAKAHEIPRGNNERILFVDDEEMIVEWGRTTLQRLGYRVTDFTDSMEALKDFASNPSSFDLVITDHAMPRIAGSKLSQEFLRIRKDIPIILCTGHSETISPERAKEIGIREFLMKPLVKQELAMAVRRVLDGGSER